MRSQVATEAGSKINANEDRALVGSNMFVVLDGLTARTDSGCVHGVAWFAEQLSSAIMASTEGELVDVLKDAIRSTALLHVDTCDLRHPGTPCAAVGIVQFQGEFLRYLVLGDVSVVIDAGDDEVVVCDSRISNSARAERAEADALPADSPGKPEVLVRMKHAELAARNTVDGYWIAAAYPEAADHALTGEMEISKIRRVAILTDGAARAVDVFKLYSWREFLDLLASSGPAELIRQVRNIEKLDPSATRWPRNKISDDATAIYLEK